ncbi:hypothetical protein B0A48_08512 [Cryoendolithus antarcticus]|uniref:Translin n=1 Tax=Cryoendolithus antarcticus TaxID=1507870 RepID=A0A1V8T5M7_9PEZI|nr:hypothetical protein B0A48_08512 [Cryoendolithus antarcticus]
MSVQNAMMESGLFEDLQKKIDEDTQVKDTLREIVQQLEKQGQHTIDQTSARSTRPDRIDSRPRDPSNLVKSTFDAFGRTIENQVQSIQRLAEVASKHPYYRYNYAWTREMQSATFSILYCAYLGGLNTQAGHLLTLSEVTTFMQSTPFPSLLSTLSHPIPLIPLAVPPSAPNTDSFHLTPEEYLQSLISLVDELSRLARNSVTLGDTARPLQISKFIKDVHAGFQVLNLRNDGLRKRSDGVKYRVKEAEDVVYDLSLRGLLPGQGKV